MLKINQLAGFHLGRVLAGGGGVVTAQANYPWHAYTFKDSPTALEDDVAAYDLLLNGSVQMGGGSVTGSGDSIRFASTGYLQTSAHSLADCDLISFCGWSKLENNNTAGQSCSFNVIRLDDTEGQKFRLEFVNNNPPGWPGVNPGAGVADTWKVTGQITDDVDVVHNESWELSIPENQWFFWAVSIDRITQEVRLRINGDTTTWSSGFPDFVSDTTLWLNVSSSFTSNQFGSLDEFYIFPQLALTDAATEWIYNGGVGRFWDIVGQKWAGIDRIADPAGGYVDWSTGENFDATGADLVFSGSGTFVDATPARFQDRDAGEWDGTEEALSDGLIVTSDDVTFAGWVRFEGTGASASTLQPFYLGHYSGGGFMTVSLKDNGGSTFDVDALSPPNVSATTLKTGLAKDAWHFIAISHDRDGDVTVRINGEVFVLATNPNNPVGGYSIKHCHNDVVISPVKLRCAEYMFWDFAMSGEQTAALYNAGGGFFIRSDDWVF